MTDLKTMVKDSVIFAEVTRWDTCQVTDQRTIDCAMDKTKSWVISPDMQVSFPISQKESNKPVVAERSTGKGAKRRQSSVPPDSDTARAKQSKKDADAAQTGPQSRDVLIGKGRPRGIDRVS